MRKQIIRLAIICGAFFLTLNLNAQKNKNIQTAVVKTTIYCDHCKICESCGGRILNELYNENGIKSTSVDPKSNTIKVVYDVRKITLETIRKKISKLGFDADNVKADPEAVKKLDDCCQKPS